MVEVGTLILAVVLALAAGLSTAIGGLIAVSFRHPKTTYLALALGLSAGVMVYISFMELLPHAIGTIGEVGGIAAFFGGLILLAMMDFLVPEENPHHHLTSCGENGANGGYLRVGYLTTFAIAIHNFPEGLSVLGVALIDIEIGVMIALAVAIHNIPEGVAVAAPIYYATGDRKRALGYALLAGLSEPAGALLGVAVLLPFLSDSLIAILLGVVGGIMVYISLDELLPAALKTGQGHVTIAGVICGMAVMAGALLLL